MTQAFTRLLERGVAGQLMQLERNQAGADKGMIQLEFEKSCQVSRSFIEQFRNDYDICLLLVTRRH